MRVSRQNRDAGLRKVQSITGWAVAGALAATGLFAGLASQSGRGSVTASTRTRVAGATPGGGSTVATPPTDDGGNGLGQATPLQPPIVPPSSSSGFAPIVSGAS
jgi:hypothetical protein